MSKYELYIPDMTERFPEGLNSECILDAECKAWAELEKDRQKEAAGYVFSLEKGWYKPAKEDK